MTTMKAWHVAVLVFIALFGVEALFEGSGGRQGELTEFQDKVVRKVETGGTAPEASPGAAARSVSRPRLAARANVAGNAGAWARDPGEDSSLPDARIADHAARPVAIAAAATLPAGNGAGAPIQPERRDLIES